MHLSLLSYGAVEVVLPRKIVLTIEKNSQTGGNLNGKQLLNSHPEEQFLITTFTVPKILMEFYNHANSQNGLKHWNQLTLILAEVMSWEILQCQQKKLWRLSISLENSSSSITQF